MTTLTKSPEFVYVGARNRFPVSLLTRANSLVASKPADIAHAVEVSSKDSVWAVRPEKLDDVFKAVLSSTQRDQPGTHLGMMLLCGPVPAAQLTLLSALRSWFRAIAGELPGYKSLPWDQLVDVLQSEDKRNLFVGGLVCSDEKVLVLRRGDLSTVVVSFNVFTKAGASLHDADNFGIDDYGYTVRFGPVEASAHAILYMVDAQYRREQNAKRKAEDQGFGPSLRRLRLMRKLGRDAFPNISDKTIARIERGETAKPQGKTLTVIAKTLGVSPEDVESY